MSEEPEFAAAAEKPSKSERKRRSDELQSLGEALIDLPEDELAALPLPDTLREAVLLARRITKRGGLYRQKQYIGKLMRKIDAEPIRAALQARRESQRLEALRFRRTEQWRERLLQEGAPGLKRLQEELPGVDLRPLAAQLERARRHGRAAPSSPAARAASRELWRMLRELLATIGP